MAWKQSLPLRVLFVWAIPRNRRNYIHSDLCGRHHHPFLNLRSECQHVGDSCTADYVLRDGRTHVALSVYNVVY